MHRGAENPVGVEVSAIAAGAFIADASIPIPWQQLAHGSVAQLLPAHGISASTGSVHSRMLSAMAADLAKNLIIVM